MNRPTIARRSDSFVRMKLPLSRRCTHISDNASRRLAIQPRPAHAEVARPMMPTEVRDSIAESIRSTNCSPKSPATRDLICTSMSASSSGLRANTKPAAAKPTISNGNNANTVKYVMPAAKKSPLLSLYRSWARMTWSNQPNRARRRSRIPGLAGSVIPAPKSVTGVAVETLTGHIPGKASSQTHPSRAARPPRAPIRVRQDRRAVHRPAP